MKIVAHPDGLVVELEGMEKFWSLRSRVEIPRKVISEIEFLDEKPPQNFAWPFIKFPGSVVPGILMAGRFVKRGERDFWFLRVKHAGMISITTKPGSFNYDRILLSCDPETANNIGRWWKA